MPTMRQPPPPQSSPAPTPSDAYGYGPATPYGVMPHGPHTTASPPHAALTPDRGPQGGQQADYPYLFQGQRSTPTQPVAPHLSSIGQPASSIVTNGTDIDPHSAGPTASFPRFTPAPLPGPAPVTPQPFVPPSLASAPPAITRKNAFPSPAPWGRDRLAALALTLLAVGFHVIWTINDTSTNQAFPSLQNPTARDYIQALTYIPLTLGAWWLMLIPISIVNIIRNQASAITTAAAIQLLFIDALILNNDPIGNPFPILCLLATGSAAIFTTRMGRTANPPRHWLVSLGMAMNLFLLISMLHRITKLLLNAKFYQSAMSSQTVNLWMTPAVGPNDRGIPLTVDHLSRHCLDQPLSGSLISHQSRIPLHRWTRPNTHSPGQHVYSLRVRHIPRCRLLRSRAEQYWPVVAVCHLPSVGCIDPAGSHRRRDHRAATPTRVRHEAQGTSVRTSGHKHTTTPACELPAPRPIGTPTHPT